MIMNMIKVMVEAMNEAEVVDMSVVVEVEVVGSKGAA